MDARWLSPHLLLPGDATDLADDIRELFDDLPARARDPAEPTPASATRRSTFARPRDVEVTIDVAGVPAPRRFACCSGRVSCSSRVTRHPPRRRRRPIFHLVEREFGRFARAVRLDGAFDVQRRTRQPCATAS